MKLQSGLQDLQSVRNDAEKIENDATRRSIVAMCDSLDVIIRNLEAMTNPKNDVLDERLFSIQDMIDNGILKKYDFTGKPSGGKNLQGAFKRRN